MDKFTRFTEELKRWHTADVQKKANRNLNHHCCSAIEFSPGFSYPEAKRVSRSFNSIPERYILPDSRCKICAVPNKRRVRGIVFKNSTLRDYKFVRKLGSGRFSAVYLALLRGYNSEVAIKVLKKTTIEEDDLTRQVLREIRIQSKLNHPNIAKLFTHFTDNNNVYLVLEYAAGGEVYRHLRNSPMERFSNSTAAKFIYQVADAVSFCHKHSVIHRDIKPENLILTSEGDIKLSDFGWSVYSPRLQRRTVCGTLDYIAPEMVEEDYYNESIDIWCIGVLCYEFLVGKPPFQSDDNKETLKRITSLQIDYPAHMCDRAVDLISKILVKNPLYRLPLFAVMSHDWVITHMNHPELAD